MTIFYEYFMAILLQILFTIKKIAMFMNLL